MKCIVISNVVGDTRLLRSELITIIDVMKKRLSTKSLRPHIDAPVLLFSIMDSGLRVLEANFEGDELVVRVTKRMDFRDEDADFSLSKFVARWWLGHPTDESTQ